MKAFHGLGVAMVTPFTPDGELDIPALKRLTRHLVDGGCDYLVVQGTTGETPTLNPVEKRRVLDAVLEENDGSLPVVLGMGGNDTRSLCKQIQSADLGGVQGLLSASPNYNKPTQAGIRAHYKAVSESTDLPIILYNVPGRTASNVLAETTLAIASDCSNIVAVKEASGDLDQIQEIICHAPEGFSVLSGDDALTLQILALGGHGLISVIGNAYPKQTSDLVNLARADKTAQARLIHNQMRDMMEAIFREGNPAGIKQVLEILEICNAQVRLPLLKASPELKDVLDHLVHLPADLGVYSA